MKKILMLVVVLMALGSVSVSGQEVTIEAVELRRSVGGSYYITFRTLNNTSRTTIAWRGNLQIRTPFNEPIWEGVLIFGQDSDLPPNGTNIQEHFMSDVRRSVPLYGWANYQFKDLKFTWTDIRVVY